MIRIKPKAGVTLAGIPAAGADVDNTLAHEWLAAGLVVRVKPTPKPKRATSRTPKPKGG